MERDLFVLLSLFSSLVSFPRLLLCSFSIAWLLFIGLFRMFLLLLFSHLLLASLSSIHNLLFFLIFLFSVCTSLSFCLFFTHLRSFVFLFFMSVVSVPFRSKNSPIHLLPGNFCRFFNFHSHFTRTSFLRLSTHLLFFGLCFLFGFVIHSLTSLESPN